MNAHFLKRALRAFASILVLAATQAVAVPTGPGIFRAYLSLGGSDANPCSLLSPCRLLPAALAAVQDGGEIWMLDSANYNTGTVFVTKSVTILAIPGALGSVVGVSGNAIEVNTPGVNLVIRNLNILNLNAGVNGVYFNGSRLTIVGSTISGFTGNNGVYADGPGQVNIVDSVLRENGNGVRFSTGASGTISRTHMLSNVSNGIYVLPTTAAQIVVHVNDSVFNGGTYGMQVQGYNGSSRAYVTRSVASGNSLDGFQTSTGGGGTDAVMIVSSSIAAANGRYGFVAFSGTTLKSTGNNTAYGNATGDTSAVTALSPI